MAVEKPEPFIVSQLIRVYVRPKSDAIAGRLRKRTWALVTAVGAFFAASLFGEKPIIREFAEAQGRISSSISLSTEFYFKFLTVVWSLYSFAKAGFYAWVATRYSLEEGFVIRATVGNLSFYGLLLISIFGARQIKSILARLNLMPSNTGALPSAVDLPS